MGPERQRVHQKTNEKPGEIIYAQEELQVARAADVEHGLVEAKELRDMSSTVRSEQAELGEKTIEFAQAQTVERIVGQFHEDKVDVIQLAPQEHFSECSVEQTMDVLGPQFHEDTVEVTAVRSVGAARSSTGSVKDRFKGKVCVDGGDDVFIHCNQLVDTEGLQQGSAVSHGAEYARKNTVTPSGGGGGDDGWSGVDVAAPQSQREIVKAVHLKPQEQAACKTLETMVEEALVAMLRSSSAPGRRDCVVQTVVRAYRA